MTPAREIIAHYRKKGLSGKELRRAVDRHARILSGCDPMVAEALKSEPLFTSDPMVAEALKSEPLFTSKREVR